MIEYLKNWLIAFNLALLAGLILTAVTLPEHFGYWLQLIDNARYEQLDCDCTEPLE